MKQIIRYEQNTPEWEAWRKHTFGASDCAAMLGISPYKTRTQLMREKQGEPQKVTDFQRDIFAQGHAAEKAIMPYLEERLGQPLSPCVMEIADGISASLDGISFEGDVIIEHKLYRDSDASRKRFQMAQEGKLADHDMAQVQQQLMVSGAAVCWFVVSNGTAQNLALVVVKPDSDWFARIREGWAQFKAALDAAESDTFAVLAESYIRLDKEIKALQETQNAVRVGMIDIAERSHADALTGGGITLKRIESKGAVDYKAIPALANIDLEQYRKPASVSWRINIGA